MMIVFVAVSMKSSDVIIEAHLISIIVLGPFLVDTQQSQEAFGRRSPTVSLALEVPLLAEIILVYCRCPWLL
jgi:hypothetical protein